jgi:nucleotide-binding universal stress UspA family protein
MTGEKMRILIAYDGSDCADAALNDLRKAGLPDRNVETLVLSVAEVWLPPPPPSSYEIVEEVRVAQNPSALRKDYAKGSRAMEQASQFARQAREQLQKSFPEWDVTAEASNGSPAWEVINRAGEWKPDLIVVGSHGRSKLGRFVLGSVSQKILTEARCSVRVARGRAEATDAPASICIGVDGSPGSEAALRAVAMRQWPPATEVHVIVVEDIRAEAATQWVESDTEERAWVDKIASGAVEVLQLGELNASSVILQGDPKRVLVAEAEGRGADSIFVGSTGFSNRFERFLLGSVSAAIAARAHCSVEVVRQPESETDLEKS